MMSVKNLLDEKEKEYIKQMLEKKKYMVAKIDETDDDYIAIVTDCEGKKSEIKVLKSGILRNSYKTK